MTTNVAAAALELHFGEAVGAAVNSFCGVELLAPSQCEQVGIGSTAPASPALSRSGIGRGVPTAGGVRACAADDDDARGLLRLQLTAAAPPLPRSAPPSLRPSLAVHCRCVPARLPRWPWLTG
jgi:hypothetical protein